MVPKGFEPLKFYGALHPDGIACYRGKGTSDSRIQSTLDISNTDIPKYLFNQGI